jgi:hypothetical protein
MPLGAAAPYGLALVLALTSAPARLAAGERAFAPGDLLLVRARLRDCPDRLRLVQVSRLGSEPVELLGLGVFAVLGETPAAVRRELEARYRDRMSGAAAPPISVELTTADAEWEAILLLISLPELDCEGFLPEPLRRPDRPPRPIIERIATR